MVDSLMIPVEFHICKNTNPSLTQKNNVHWNHVLECTPVEDSPIGSLLSAQLRSSEAQKTVYPILDTNILTSQWLSNIIGPLQTQFIGAA